ncbi:Nuclear cap-binding protein subunit 3 [Plecturocebus cupreus]
MRASTVSSSNIEKRTGKKQPPEKFAHVRQKKSGNRWTRFQSAPKTKGKNTKKGDRRAPGPEEDDSEPQRAWAPLIKEKGQSRQKKSGLDHSASLLIEASRESSCGSEAESGCPRGRWQLPSGPTLVQAGVGRSSSLPAGPGALSLLLTVTLSSCRFGKAS